MAQYRVKNGSALDKAFKVYGGHHIVAAGKEEDVVNASELTEAQIDALARDGVKVTVKADKGKESDGSKTLAYSVKEQSAGWFAVVGADGKPVTKNLRQDDVKDFDGMSDSDRSAFIDMHKVA